MTTHVQRMTESMKRKPLKIEVFERVYVPKAGDPPPRVVETRKKYNELKVQAESEGKSFDFDDSELFCKAVPKYKWWRFGAGSEAEVLSGSMDFTSRITGPSQEEINARIQEQVDARFSQQQQIWQTHMANMTNTFMSYLE